MARRLLKQFVAIIIGNAIYFLLLMPHLPATAQHRPDKLDLGLWWTSGCALRSMD